jgi:hypothetical protein
MPPLSEKSLTKARRLVADGRVSEVTAVRTFVVAGDHDTYLVTVGVDGAACSCPAYVAHCSHVEAVLLTIGGSPPERPRVPAATNVAGEALAPVPAGRLFTWYSRAALDADPLGVTLVRISLGRPKWIHPARTAAIPYIAELAPVGRLFDLDEPEFDRAYRSASTRSASIASKQRFRELAATHGGRPLILLCFERDRADCHRGTFATWWRTGLAK